MTDKNAPAVIDDPQTTPAPEPDGAPVPEAQTAGSSSMPLIIALLSLFLGIGLVVAAYFIWYEVQRLNHDQAGIEASVSDRIRPIRSSLDSVNQTLTDEREELEDRLERLNGERQSLANRLNVLAALMGRSERGWALAEVEYLLRIADQRLQLQRDLKTAEQALLAADNRLRDLADTHYLTVREQIARDLEAVRAVPSVDIDGMSATISAAISSVDKLAVEGSRYQPVTPSENTSDKQAKATAGNFKDLVQIVWASLSDLFRIREHDRPIRPMIPPDREYFLRENLRLQLAAARLALLRNDTVQFRSALETTSEWLNAYFDMESSNVKQLDKQVAELVSVDISPALPNVADSLRLLQQQMQLSEQQAVLPVVPEGPAKADIKQSEETATKPERSEGTQ